ncbi:MAG: hypothetical protein AAF234_05850, partial [Pseudomonadota bacterium]
EQYIDKKYTVETRFNQATGMPTHMVWSNEHGVAEAPGDLPAEMIFDDKGLLKLAIWKKDGEAHRDNDLPAKIAYNPETRKPIAYTWCQNGVQERQGEAGKPSYLQVYDSGRLCALEFTKDGEHWREGGKPPYITFDEHDGTAYDADENVIEFDGYDQSWLPESDDMSVNLDYS